jgi:hypothetical protein
MTSDGSPYPRLKRAIAAGNLAIIEATTAELGWVALRDALGILLVIEAKDAERFERSAVRWAGRLALEVPDLALAELAGALESLHALPDEHAQRSLLALAERARKPRPPAASAPRDVDRSHRLGLAQHRGVVVRCSPGCRWFRVDERGAGRVTHQLEVAGVRHAGVRQLLGVLVRDRALRADRRRRSARWRRGVSPSATTGIWSLCAAATRALVELRRLRSPCDRSFSPAQARRHKGPTKDPARPPRRERGRSRPSAPGPATSTDMRLTGRFFDRLRHRSDSSTTTLALILCSLEDRTCA